MMTGTLPSPQVTPAPSPGLEASLFPPTNTVTVISFSSSSSPLAIENDLADLVPWSPAGSEMLVTAGLLWLLAVSGLLLNSTLLAAYWRTWRQCLVLPPSAVAVNLCLNNLLLVLGAFLAAATLTFDLGAGGTKAGGTQTFLGMHVLLQSWLAQVMVVYCGAKGERPSRDEHSSEQQVLPARQSSRPLQVCGNCLLQPNPRRKPPLTLARRESESVLSAGRSGTRLLATAISLQMSVKQKRMVVWWAPWTWLLSLLSGTALLMSANKDGNNLCLTLDPFRPQYLVSGEEGPRNEEDRMTPRRVPLLLILLPVYLVGVILMLWAVCRARRAKRSEQARSRENHAHNTLQGDEENVDDKVDTPPSGKSSDHSPTTHTHGAASLPGLRRASEIENKGSDACPKNLQQSCAGPGYELNIGDSGSQNEAAAHAQYPCDHYHPKHRLFKTPLSAQARNRLGLVRPTKRLHFNRKRARLGKKAERQTGERAGLEPGAVRGAEREETDITTVVSNSNKNATEMNLLSIDVQRGDTPYYDTPALECICEDELATSSYLDNSPFGHGPEESFDPDQKLHDAAQNINTSSAYQLDREAIVTHGILGEIKKAGKNKRVSFDSEIDYAIYDTDDYVLLSHLAGVIVDNDMAIPLSDKNKNAPTKKAKSKDSSKTRRPKKKHKKNDMEMFEVSTEGKIPSVPPRARSLGSVTPNHPASLLRGRLAARHAHEQTPSETEQRQENGGLCISHGENDNDGDRGNMTTTRSQSLVLDNGSRETSTNRSGEPGTCQPISDSNHGSQTHGDRDGDSDDSSETLRNGQAWALDTNTNASSKRRSKGTRRWRDREGEVAGGEHAECPEGSVASQDVDAQSLSSSGDSSSLTSRYAKLHPDMASGLLYLKLPQKGHDSVNLQSPSSTLSCHSVISGAGPGGGPGGGGAGRVRVGTAARIVSSSMHHFTLQGPPPSAAHLLSPGWLCQHQRLPHPQTQLQHQRHLTRLSAVHSSLSSRSSSQLSRAPVSSPDTRSLQSKADESDKGEADDRQSTLATRAVARETLCPLLPANEEQPEGGAREEERVTDSIDELLGRLTYFRTHDVAGISSQATVVDVPSLRNFRSQFDNVATSGDALPAQRRATTLGKAQGVAAASETYSESSAPSIPCAGDVAGTRFPPHTLHAHTFPAAGVVTPRFALLGSVKDLTNRQAGDLGRCPDDWKPQDIPSRRPSAKSSPPLLSCFRLCGNLWRTQLSRKAVCLTGLFLHALTCVPFAVALLPGVWGPLDCESRLVALIVIRLLMFTHVIFCPLWLLMCHGRQLLPKPG